MHRRSRALMMNRCLILAIPVGAAFVLMVIISLPIWALTKDEGGIV